MHLRNVLLEEEKKTPFIDFHFLLAEGGPMSFNSPTLPGCTCVGDVMFLQVPQAKIFLQGRKQENPRQNQGEVVSGYTEVKLV